MALVNQISTILNDAVKDALGKNAGVAKIDTSDIVSMGKLIESMDLYEGFYKSLVNRIVKTVYFIRTYNGSSRSVLRDEHEYGAFIQKVYYEMPDAVDNPTWNIPQESGGNLTYGQASPYDVEGTVAVSSIIFGGKGTWSIEILRPVEQIKSAFLDTASMASFIDGIYVAVENAFKIEEERLIALAVNTSMASSLDGGKARNLLGEYNEKFTESLTPEQALTDAGFLRYASMEINRVVDNMATMGTAYNKAGYTTFTSRENLVVEMLSQFASASDMYLQADTFHNNLVSLPNFERVPFWQSSGKNFAFNDCSTISIEHDSLDNDEVTQAGIISFVHDTENVACYFGNRRSWEMVNPRQEVVIHGEKAEKGFAVDDHANAIVFYMAQGGTISGLTGEGYTATTNVSSVVRGQEIVLTITTEGTVDSVKIGTLELETGEDGKYRYTPTSDSNIEFTITLE